LISTHSVYNPKKTATVAKFNPKLSLHNSNPGKVGEVQLQSKRHFYRPPKICGLNFFSVNRT